MKELHQLVRPNIQRLAGLLSATAAPSDGGSRLRLDRSESPFNAPSNRYPDAASSALTEALNRHLGVRPECIVLTAGSYDALSLLVRTFCIPQKDNILTTTPSAGPIERIALAADVELRRVPLRTDFSISRIDLMAAVGERSKLIVLQSPGDPSGLLVDSAEAIRTARSFGGLLVVDESYIEYARQPSILATPAGLPEGLVVVRTFSRAYAAAGLRVGYIIASPAVCRYLRAAASPWPVSLPSLREATDLLLHRYEVDKWVNQLLEERNKVMLACRALPFCEKVYPTHANFFLLRVTDPATVLSRLAAAGIAVADVGHLPGLERCLRISIGLPDDNRALLSALRGI